MLHANRKARLTLFQTEENMRRSRRRRAGCGAVASGSWITSPSKSRFLHRNGWQPFLDRVVCTGPAADQAFPMTVCLRRPTLPTPRLADLPPTSSTILSTSP